MTSADETAGAVAAPAPTPDPWVIGLAPGHRDRAQHLRDLHALLLRAARHELRRRAGAGRLGPGELDDLAHQVADDALLSITAKLADFRGASRFTTWAYKFVIFEVSNQLARRAVRERREDPAEPEWDRIPDGERGSPAHRAEQYELLAALRRAIAEDLTPRQREVFVAVALREEPMDVVALRLDTNRNAVYKNLFDARRRLRAALAEAGHTL